MPEEVEQTKAKNQWGNKIIVSTTVGIGIDTLSNVEYVKQYILSPAGLLFRQTYVN